MVSCHEKRPFTKNTKEETDEMVILKYEWVAGGRVLPMLSVDNWASINDIGPRNSNISPLNRNVPHLHSKLPFATTMLNIGRANCPSA